MAATKRWFWTAVKSAVTLGCLGWVLWMIEWQDKLLLPDGTTARGKFVAAGPADGAVRGFLLEKDNRHPIPAFDAARAVGEIGKPLVDPFQPGFVQLLRGVSKKRLALAALLLPLTSLILALRWHWLLRTHGIDVGLLETVRLTWVGLFMNNVLPSSIGGDAVKAVCIARRSPGQRVDAAMTVLVDRALGLVSLLAVGGCAVALGDLPLQGAGLGAAGGKLKYLPWALFGALFGIVGGAFVFFSGRFRAWLRVPQLLAWLPGGRRLGQLDQALFHFRGHPVTMARSILISIGLHLLSVTIISLIGGALGMNAKLSHYFMFVPLIFVGTAFLPSIAGLGVQESAFVFFFTLPFVGDRASQALALSLLYRVMQMLLTLPGGLWAHREMSFAKHAAPPAEPAALPAG